MEFETVERRGRLHVIMNGVPSILSTTLFHGEWVILRPTIAYVRQSRIDALAFIAEQMGDWYTASEAAERLVELGAFGKPPSAHDVCMWARYDKLPGAVKVPMPGQGGSWRIPGAALAEFAKGRKER